MSDGLKLIKVDQKLAPLRDIAKVGLSNTNSEAMTQERQNLIFFVGGLANLSTVRAWGLGDLANDDQIDNNVGINPGMNYFNRFVVDENDQFEVYAFYRLKKTARNEDRWNQRVKQIKEAVKKYAEQSKRDKNDDNTVHFIWAELGREFFDHNDLVKTINDELASFGLKRGIVTFLFKRHFHCVTKEKYQQLYKIGGQVSMWKMDLSFGDDLEDFQNRIKNNEIYDHEFEFDEHECWINTYHLSLLVPEEKRKLATNDVDYINIFEMKNPDVPKEEMAKSESKSKYLFSLCQRKTYIISPNVLFAHHRLPPPFTPICSRFGYVFVTDKKI